MTLRRHQARIPAFGQRGWGRFPISGTLCLLVVVGCGGGDSIGPPPDISLAVTPREVFGGGNVMLAATVSASNGIDSVKFFRVGPDLALLGSVDKPPYEWPALAYGGATTVTTTFSSRACDQAGLCTDSNTVSVTSRWICKLPPC